MASPPRRQWLRAQSSLLKDPNAPTPITVNKYRPRQTPLTPPISPTRASEQYVKNPEQQTWPVEKYFTSPREPPSPPRHELNGQESGSRYHIDSNNIVFPKTLRHQQETEAPLTESQTKFGLLRRSLTGKRQTSPSPPRDEFNVSEPAPTYHSASNNIAFPKTLRRQQEQDVPRAQASPAQDAETPSKQGFFRRSLTSKRQQPQAVSRDELHGEEEEPRYHRESKNIFFPKTLRQPLQEPEKTTGASQTRGMPPSPPSNTQRVGGMQQRPPRSPETFRASPSLGRQVGAPAIGRHAGLANKTLRRSRPQPQPQPRPQSSYTPLSEKSLRPEESRGLGHRSMQTVPRQTPRPTSMAETTPPAYEQFQGGERRPPTTVTTDVRTTQLPAVTHEHIQPTAHHINTKEYTREIHNHDVYNRILPVRDTEVRPTRHFAPSPTDSGRLVEIPAPDEKRGGAQATAAPISMDMASNTTCTKDVSGRFHDPSDNTIPFPSVTHQSQEEALALSRQHNLEMEQQGRQLVSEKSYTLPDGTMRTESVWRYQPTMKAPVQEITETITRPPGAARATSPAVADRDGQRAAPSRAPGPSDYTIGRGRQEQFHPSVVSEWDQVSQPSPSPSAKAQAARSYARGISDEIGVQDYRQGKEQRTETEPISQRPARPSPSRASPNPSNQRSLLAAITSTVMPQKTVHRGTPQPPGKFEDLESGSDYSSAPSEQPTPTAAPEKKRRPSGELLPGGIWRRHSLVIPAGIVRNGNSLMGAGMLMADREREEGLAMHRLKKASKAEADRVRALEGEPPSLQNKHEMEKLTRRKTEERQREASLNEDIQKLLAAEATLEQERVGASKLDEGISKLERQADGIIKKEDELEAEIDESRRRRISLLREAESEHQKAQALHSSKQKGLHVPGPHVLQAHRRRRSRLLHHADDEQQRIINLQQKKEDTLEKMDQRNAKARQDLDTTLDEAVLADKERQEEVQVNKFLSDEVQKQEQNENLARQGKAPAGKGFTMAPPSSDLQGTSPYDTKYHATEPEAEDAGWTEVVKPRHGHAKEAARGNGTQKLPAQRQNGSTNHNGQAKKGISAVQQKLPSPPNTQLPQPPGNVGTGYGAPGSSSSTQPRSWANIAASKPL
ncbi:hypothetical protein GMDG_05167 [Pseudogymnoascus destructans 20631-21]|uniref:Uncharacterized protein n=1 Tax=Pseudogymnoascus destructans (strain ATCC MYA-4855 / 20631-21) TaxID=658429 RepID=L8FNF8_PSED2|nr:hypothetical protein GMDG_05167 [Pseudogymnoascus destructans 20631-21]